jgi:Heterokaryon incompatibility protein (HET)
MSWRELWKLWTLRRRTAFNLFRRSRIESSSTRLQKASQTILFCSILYPPIKLWHELQRAPDKLANSPGSLPAFRYDPLPITDPENGTNPAFRLLVLHPGHELEEVECTLTESHLLDDVPYETISYRWDDEWTTIACNGTALSIPSSLAEALSALRYRDKPRRLWADAICINQHDDAEKGNQVQLMRRIYSQAQGVLIWLGEAAGDGKSDSLVSFPARLAIRFGLVALTLGMDKSNSPCVQVRDARKGTTNDLAPFSVELYLQLIGLLRKPWFGRAWVVQEVAVSKKATVCWGSKQCEWNELIDALSYMSKARFPLAFMPTLQHIAGIEEETKRYKQGTNTLLGLLLRHQRCSSTKRRDKVYAFCGLMGTSPSRFIDVRIRYEDAVESVYRDVATKILQHERNLDILSHRPLPKNISSGTSDLPSWVPDWSRCTGQDMAHAWGIGPLSLTSREMDSQFPTKSSFNATRGSLYTPSPSPSINSLIVSGYTFDIVTATGPVFNGNQVPFTITTLRGIVRSWLYTLHTFCQARNVLFAWEDIAQARSQTSYTPDSSHHHNTKIDSKEPILTAFYRTISTSEYDTAPTIRNELRLWNMVNRPFPFLQKIHLDTIVMIPYSAVLLLWYAVANGSLLKFELQARHTLHRRFIRTERGYIGLAGNEVRVGDSVVLCRGGMVPLVLRRVEAETEVDRSTGRERPDKWRLVGDAYIHGIMDGEAFDEGSCESMILV